MAPSAVLNKDVQVPLSDYPSIEEELVTLGYPPEGSSLPPEPASGPTSALASGPADATPPGQGKEGYQAPLTTPSDGPRQSDQVDAQANADPVATAMEAQVSVPKDPKLINVVPRGAEKSGQKAAE
ncbi:MAG: hypothetical protein LBF40_06555, partial [Deltaproteobacteria bacterium]|nr:hypothetical protein [Deltaproteobacteria bacterium]